VLNAIYQIHHKDTGDALRNACYNQIHGVLSRSYQYLGSYTAYLSSFKEMNDFLNATPKFTVRRMPPAVPGGLPFPVNSGIIGIVASNYIAYKKFLETDKDVMFLFEDDALVSENFVAITEAYIRELPADWDFFSLFMPEDCIQWFSYPRQNQPWVKSNDGGPTTYDIGRPNVVRSYQDWSCAGYAVSRKGAEAAVKDIESRGVSDPIDWYIFNLRHLDPKGAYFETYSIHPTSFRPVRLSQASNNTTIHYGVTESAKA
jgi:hypothetical protein